MKQIVGIKCVQLQCNCNPQLSEIIYKNFACGSTVQVSLQTIQNRPEVWWISCLEVFFSRGNRCWNVRLTTYISLWGKFCKLWSCVTTYKIRKISWTAGEKRTISLYQVQLRKHLLVLGQYQHCVNNWVSLFFLFLPQLFNITRIPRNKTQCIYTNKISKYYSIRRRFRNCAPRGTTVYFKIWLFLSIYVY